MRRFPLKIDAFVRATHVIVPEFSVMANVSKSQWDSKAEAFVERTPKSHYNLPDFEHNSDLGYTFAFRKHNAYHAQKKYFDTTKDFVQLHGTHILFYTTTFDTSANPLTKEDNTRTIDRVFEVPIIVGFNPQNEIYKRFGIQFTNKLEIYIHMGLFLERNYRSLRDAGIEPICDPGEHDPEWSQRGYSTFRYHGYTAAQIFPKAGDLMKMEYNNILYSVSSITDEIPEYEYMWHKFWWKAYLEVAVDNGQEVSQDVIDSPINQHFIDNLFGSTSLGKATDPDSTNTLVDTSGNPLALDAETLLELKKDVLFRPPEVDKCVQDVSADPNSQPCGEYLGTW